MGLFVLNSRLFLLGAGKCHWAPFGVTLPFPSSFLERQQEAKRAYISEALGYFQVMQPQIPSLATPLPFCFKTLFGLKVLLVFLLFCFRVLEAQPYSRRRWAACSQVQGGLGGKLLLWGTLAPAYRAIWDCGTDCVILPRSGPISR